MPEEPHHREEDLKGQTQEARRGLRAHFRRNARAAVHRHNNWGTFFTGVAVGGGVRYGLRVAFAVAAAHVTMPAAVAFAIPLASAAVIGAAVKVATVRATVRNRPKGWVMQAALQGAAFGLLGGVAGDIIADFIPVHQVADYISHHFFPAPALRPLLAPPVIAPPALLPPMLDPAIRADIGRILQSGMLRGHPGLRKIGEMALRSNDPKALTHFCKEASYFLINGQRHKLAEKVTGARLIGEGLKIARTFRLHNITALQLNADESYLKLHGLYGRPRDVAGAITNARQAGRFGRRFLKYALALPKPAPAG